MSMSLLVCHGVEGCWPWSFLLLRVSSAFSWIARRKSAARRVRCSLAQSCVWQGAGGSVGRSSSRGRTVWQNCRLRCECGWLCVWTSRDPSGSALRSFPIQTRHVPKIHVRIASRALSTTLRTINTNMRQQKELCGICQVHTPAVTAFTICELSQGTSRSELTAG